jgi:hypothetical protein
MLAFRAWLDEPLVQWKCALGWIVSLSIFAGLVEILSGPTDSDSSITTYSTWAIAHGSFSCAYPHANTLAAPLYPLLSGGIAALLHIGGGLPFPSNAQFGPHCSTAVAAMSNWALHANAYPRTLQIGDLSWLVVLGGLVALLRTTARGRRGWEPFALVLMAVSLPVVMPLVEDFHPQDLVAFGLMLWALAYARRGSWSFAGVFIGLAFTSQQFAALTAVILFVIAPHGRRLRFSLGALGAIALIDLPFLILTSGRATRAILVGTGLSASYGRTLMAESPLRNATFVVAAVLPILATLAFAVWLVRRVGRTVLEADILIVLLAVSLCVRLVFELDVWGYYFMPLSVALVTLDVLKGKIRGTTIAWLAMVTLVFNPIVYYHFATGRTYNSGPFIALEIVFLVAAFLLIVWDAAHRRVRWYLIAWFVLAVLATAVGGWDYGPTNNALPLWFWQIVLLASAIALFAPTLRTRLREHVEVISALPLTPS